MQNTQNILSEQL